MSVTWNGTTIDLFRPVLIYHDEVRFIPPETVDTLGDPGSLALVCRSESCHRVSWNHIDGSIVTNTSSPAFFQHRTEEEETPSIAGLLRYESNSVPSASHNGLWTCRLNNNYVGYIPVGLYQRGGGEEGLRTFCTVISLTGMLIQLHAIKYQCPFSRLPHFYVRTCMLLLHGL